MELSLGRVHLVQRQSLNVANPARVQNLSVGKAASSHRKASAFPKGISTGTRERFETCVRSRKGNPWRDRTESGRSENSGCDSEGDGVGLGRSATLFSAAHADPVECHVPLGEDFFAW